MTTILIFYCVITYLLSIGIIIGDRASYAGEEVEPTLLALFLFIFSPISVPVFLGFLLGCK